MKKFFALLLLLSMMLPLVALADTLVMGSNCSFPPFEYIDEQGNPAGFDVEIGKLIAEKMGKEFYLENMDFDGLLLALNGGKIDMAIAGMTITDKRKAEADFSESYFNAKQVVVVKKGYEDIKTFDDLKTKTVSVQDGTTGYLMATETLALPTEKVVGFKSANDAVAELKLGRVDCMILDSAPAKVFVAKNDDLVILENIETPSEDYGIAVKKGNADLLKVVNEVLAEIKANGTYDALIDKYFK